MDTNRQDVSTPLGGWAARYRARAEADVGVAEIRLDATERAVITALDHPEVEEVEVLGVVVPRQASSEVLAMAESDLSRARRRLAAITRLARSRLRAVFGR